MEKRPALGKGLSALIPDLPEPRTSATEVDIDRLASGDFQPRAHADDGRLEELARSIRANGIIQPIVTRKLGDRFQIIAGERRWRAALRAGLLRVPIVVRDVAVGQEQSLLEMALIENIQREDLNPIQEALAYRRLSDEFQLTQEDIAVAVGKDRATIANHLRLLKLPDDIKASVASGALSMGHARALLALSRSKRPAPPRDRSHRQESVGSRDRVEGEDRITDGGGEAPAAGRSPEPVDVHTRAAEERLRLALGTRANPHCPPWLTRPDRRSRSIQRTS